MNREGIARALSKEYGFPKSLSREVLGTVLETIQAEVKKGRLVRFRNFGTFRAKMSRGKLRAKFYASKNFMG